MTKDPFVDKFLVIKTYHATQGLALMLADVLDHMVMGVWCGQRQGFIFIDLDHVVSTEEVLTVIKDFFMKYNFNYSIINPDKALAEMWLAWYMSNDDYGLGLDLGYIFRQRMRVLRKPTSGGDGTVSMFDEIQILNAMMGVGYYLTLKEGLSLSQCRMPHGRHPVPLPWQVAWKDGYSSNPSRVFYLYPSARQITPQKAEADRAMTDLLNTLGSQYDIYVSYVPQTEKRYGFIIVIVAVGTDLESFSGNWKQFLNDHRDWQMNEKVSVWYQNASPLLRVLLGLGEEQRYLLRGDQKHFIL